MLAFLSLAQCLDLAQTIALIAATVIAAVALVRTSRHRKNANKLRRLERVYDAIDELRAAIAHPPSAEKDQKLVPVAMQRVNAAHLIATVDGTKLGQTEILTNNPPTDDQALSAQMQIAREVAKL